MTMLKNIKAMYKARQTTKRVKASITKRQKAVRKRIRARSKRVGVEFRVAVTILPLVFTAASAYLMVASKKEEGIK